MKPTPAVPAPVPSHNHGEPARIYRLDGELAVPVGSVMKDASGLKHVTILGAVERPGAYYFSGKLKLETLITSAGPIRTELGCGSACLAQVTISSSKRFADRDSFMINYLKYMEAKGPSARATCALEGGELVYVPELF